jgi:hypothetical protein
MAKVGRGQTCKSGARAYASPKQRVRDEVADLMSPPTQVRRSIMRPLDSYTCPPNIRQSPFRQFGRVERKHAQNSEPRTWLLQHQILKSSCSRDATRCGEERLSTASNAQFPDGAQDRCVALAESIQTVLRAKPDVELLDC